LRPGDANDDNTELPNELFVAVPFVTLLCCSAEELLLFLPNPMLDGGRMKRLVLLIFHAEQNYPMRNDVF